MTLNIAKARFGRTFRITMMAAACSAAVVPQFARAQIPVTDIASLVQQMVDYISQGLQYAEQIDQYTQQLTDYSLQLQNLQQLPGSIRSQVESRLATQLTSNTGDFGVSYLGGLPKLDPGTGSFYGNAENMFRTAYSSTPRTLPALTPDLSSLGIPADMTSPIYKGAYADRLTWERLLDDMRLVALTRKNAESRASEANTITTQMRAMPDNNTVGAIQLLAGQQSLGYAQQEDLLKTQAQTLRVLQQREAQALAEQDDVRQQEIARLNKVKSRPVPTGGTIPIF